MSDVVHGFVGTEYINIMNASYDSRLVFALRLEGISKFG